MRACALFLLGVSGLIATDSQQLALVWKARSDFDRVALSPTPVLAEAGNCQQSQAAALAASSPEEASLLYYRKGYCILAGAVVTHSNREFLAAAADFDRALAAWGTRRSSRKNEPPKPAPSGLRVLPWIARLHAGADDSVRSAAAREIAAAVEPVSCASNLMPIYQCEQLVETGRQWLGWIALQENRLDDAAKGFTNAEATGWPDWIQGRRQFQQGDYVAAVSAYTGGIRIWRSIWQDPGPSLARRLGPAPNLPQALADLGGAQLLAGETKGAIASLDASIKSDPSNAQALYRRARAYDIAGKPEQALGDYNLASRTAFANAKELASGEGHLYRGIMLYRRKDFARAENEFSSALNFEIPEPLRADARGWRHMAATASGSCVSARELDRALPAVSPYFPKDEARRVASACPASAQLGTRN